MGKIEEEQPISPPTDAAEATEGNAGRPRCQIWRSVGLRCVAAVLLGVAVLLSTVFWLPPFLSSDWERHQEFGAIVASFKLQKPVSLLQANVMNLENDIFGEIGVPDSMVLVASLEPLAGSSWTNVVFGVGPYEKNSTISSIGLSLLKASFMSLVANQSTLHLTPSLFGDSSFFQVLKFPGGITVIPHQSGFLLQKGQILFNFTLNCSIYQIQEIFDELKYQLMSGLHLTPYENLYIRLTNLRGSTIDPPIIVQSSVLFAVGNVPPSLPRLKQLAQAITGSPARNLGLNHTVFGKVKQIRLSSSFEHSLNSSTGSGPSGTSLSPSPLPHPSHHHHHHHHPHHHHPNVHLAPAPAPAPAPQHSYRSPSPSPCHFRFSREPRIGGLTPYIAPTVSPHPSFAAPRLNGDPPSPASHSRPSSPPLRAVFLGYVQPPSKTISHVPPGATPSVSPLPSSSSVASLPAVQLFQCGCALLCLIMHL